MNYRTPYAITILLLAYNTHASTVARYDMQYVQSDHYLILAAIDPDTHIDLGMLTARKTSDMETMYLEFLWVNEQMQRAGIGTRLFEQMLRIAYNRNLNVEFYAEPFNPDFTPCPPERLPSLVAWYTKRIQEWTNKNEVAGTISCTDLGNKAYFEVSLAPMR